MPGQSAHALAGVACPRLSERVMTRKGVSVSRIQACQEALNPICTCALKVVESLCILAPLEVLRLAQFKVRSARMSRVHMRSITTWRRINVCSSGVKSRGCRHGLGIVHCDTDDVQPLLCWSSRRHWSHSLTQRTSSCAVKNLRLVTVFFLFFCLCVQPHRP